MSQNYVLHVFNTILFLAPNSIDIIIAEMVMSMPTVINEYHDWLT